MKSAKKAKSLSKPVTRRRATTTISLSERVLRLERELLVRPAVPALPRYVNLGADCKPTTGDYVATWDRSTNLVHVAAPLLNGKNVNHTDAMQACADLDLFNRKVWRPYSSPYELLSIVDYDRCNPAVDPAHFKGPFGWTWTGKNCAARSGAAWVVYLNSGSTNWGSRDDLCQVRAVCAGQQLGLSGIEA